MTANESFDKIWNQISKDRIQEWTNSILSSCEQIKETNDISLDKVQSIIYNSINESKELVIAQLMHKIAQVESERNVYKAKHQKVKQLLQETYIKHQEQSNKSLGFGDISIIQNIKQKSSNSSSKKENICYPFKSNSTNTYQSQKKDAQQVVLENIPKEEDKLDYEHLCSKVKDQQDKLKILCIQLLKNQEDLQKFEQIQRNFRNTIEKQQDQIKELEYERNNLLSFIKSTNKLDQSIVGQELIVKTAALMEKQSQKIISQNNNPSKSQIIITPTKQQSLTDSKYSPIGSSSSSKNKTRSSSKELQNYIKKYKVI